MKRTVVLKAMTLALIFSALGASSAQAYIDPNTGGQLFQLLAVAFGALSAILLLFSSYIRKGFARFRRFLRGLMGRRPEEWGVGDSPTEGVQEASDPGSDSRAS